MHRVMRIMFSFGRKDSAAQTPARAIDVADFLVEHFIDRRAPITHLKLQKLLWFAWIEYYDRTGACLFEDPFYAWKLGPTVKSVRREYRAYVSNPIRYVRRTPYPQKLGEDVEEFLRAFAEARADDDPVALMKESQKEGGAWAEFYRKDCADAEIPFDAIVELECFGARSHPFAAALRASS